MLEAMARFAPARPTNLLFKKYTNMLMGGGRDAGRHQAQKNMFSPGEGSPEFLCDVAAFVVNSEPQTGLRPSVCVCGATHLPLESH
jgi:hypothetical protein